MENINMENDKKFVIPEATIIEFDSDDIITDSKDVEDFEDPKTIPFI